MSGLIFSILVCCTMYNNCAISMRQSCEVMPPRLLGHRRRHPPVPCVHLVRPCWGQTLSWSPGQFEVTPSHVKWNTFRTTVSVVLWGHCPVRTVVIVYSLVSIWCVCAAVMTVITYRSVQLKDKESKEWPVIWLRYLMEWMIIIYAASKPQPLPCESTYGIVCVQCFTWIWWTCTWTVKHLFLQLSIMVYKYLLIPLLSHTFHACKCGHYIYHFTFYFNYIGLILSHNM